MVGGDDVPIVREGGLRVYISCVEAVDTLSFSQASAVLGQCWRYGHTDLSLVVLAGTLLSHTPCYKVAEGTDRQNFSTASHSAEHHQETHLVGWC